METSTDLVRKSTVKEMVEAWQVAEATVRRTFAELVAAEEALSRVFSYERSNRIKIDATNGSYYDDFSNPKRALDRMQRQAWSYIVDRLEMRRVMSVARYKELHNELDRGQLPAITEENVYAFCSKYADDLPNLIRESAQEVFEWLRPRGSAYKTNSELEIGERVILKGVVDLSYTRGFRVSHYYTQELVALESVFNALAGYGQICKGWQSMLQTEIEKSTDGTGETDLFEFKACKNHNLHLRFKRLDLLKRFNMLAGGKRLAPANKS